jgi:hypothetical protein
MQWECVHCVSRGCSSPPIEAFRPNIGEAVGEPFVGEPLPSTRGTPGMPIDIGGGARPPPSELRRAPPPREERGTRAHLQQHATIQLRYSAAPSVQ